MSARQWAELLFLSVLWGGTFIAVEVALVDLDPLLLVNLRVGLAAMALFIVIRIRRESIPKSAKVWTAFLVMGLLNNALPFSLMFWSQSVITASLASILNAATPIFGVLVAGAVLADEPLTRNRLAGAFVGLLGVTIMIGPSALGGLGQETWAQLAFLAGTLSYGLAGAYGRRFAAWGLSPLVTAMGQLTMATVLMVPLVVFGAAWPVWSDIRPATILAVLSLALVSTAFAYLLYFRLLRSAGSSNLMLVTLLIPITAIALGVAFLNEVLTTNQIIGMLVIALGLVLVDGRALRLLGNRHA